LKKLTIILIFAFQSIFAQDIVPNGYNIFYYGNGQISSEGNMINGKPDGYWKTYYVNGTIKYNEKGNITERISYYFGKKNGYYFIYKYEPTENDSIIGWLDSKELYVNDSKEGDAFYYYPDGKLYKKFRFEKGRKNGLGLEFSKDSTIITILEYKNDFPINREEINRTCSRGLKQGTWKSFYSGLKLKVEENYLNGKLHGYYREYNENGKVIKLQRYQNGVVIEENAQAESITVEIKNTYFDNGKVKKNGSYIDNKPVGFHREYSEEGIIVASEEYNEIGILLGSGIVDETGKRQGDWIHYYETGEKKSEGKYLNDKKTGEWRFYFKSGKLEQKGSYKKGNPEGLWNWYFENGNIEREETFVNGKEEGMMIEYSETGKIMTKGEFFDGLEEGIWFYNVGDHTEEGEYKGGQPDGIWKHYYANGKLKFQGNYNFGEADGKHKFYFDSGKIQEEGNYNMGIKNGNWKKYDDEGNIKVIITYENGIEKRIDGMKIRGLDN